MVRRRDAVLGTHRLELANAIFEYVEGGGELRVAVAQPIRIRVQAGPLVSRC
jgi:hypothetical protein